jgi:hypothetical protein
VERACIAADPESPSPHELRRCLAEVFASLDERPRGLYLALDVRGAGGAEVSLDLVDGEPVFRIEGQSPARCRLGRRYLAEHPVPLVLRGGRAAFVLEPASGNRVRVRLPKLHERFRRWLAERIFGILHAGDTAW